MNTARLELKALGGVMWIASIVIIVFVSLPSVYICVWSFKGTTTVGILGPASYRWYDSVFHNIGWAYAALYSIVVATISSALAVSAGLLYFYFSMWHRRYYQTIGYLTLIGPLFFPAIVYGLALRMTLNSHSCPEWLGLIIGHTLLMLPVLFFLLESSNEFVQIEWIYSSATMGASHWEIIRNILAPLIKRPLLTAFGIGMLMSFDEIVIASAVIDSAHVTVPKKMWDVVNRDMDPTPAVIATLLLAVAFIALVLSRAYQRLLRSN
jgi:ABC-type spermidine/putrescine transport system permease subunit II